nr:hypothetical protein NCPCFENI_00896 [Cupriavidus sp.]
MQITHPNPVLGKVVGELLGHFLSQRSNQHPLGNAHSQPNFGQKIVHLGPRRTHLNVRICQPRGTHQLLDDSPLRLFELIGRGRGRDKDCLS